MSQPIGYGPEMISGIALRTRGIRSAASPNLFLQIPSLSLAGLSRKEFIQSLQTPGFSKMGLKGSFAYPEAGLASVVSILALRSMAPLGRSST